MKLPGAKFTLTPINPTGESIVKESGHDGRIIFDNLKAGTYTLEETEAPSGYTKSEGKWKVEVNQEGNTLISVISKPGIPADVEPIDKIKNIFQPNNNEGFLLKKDIILNNQESTTYDGFKLSQYIEKSNDPRKYKVKGSVEKLVDDLEMVIVLEETKTGEYRYGTGDNYKYIIKTLIEEVSAKNPKAKFTLIGVNSVANKRIDRQDKDSAISILNRANLNSTSTTRNGIPSAYNEANNIFSNSQARQKVLVHLSGYSIYPRYDINVNANLKVVQ